MPPLIVLGGPHDQPQHVAEHARRVLMHCACDDRVQIAVIELAGQLVDDALGQQFGELGEVLPSQP
ncbi:MAG: hypothetical protein ACJ74U_07530 [Jatrophihabitantaceae bacterium]